MTGRVDLFDSTYRHFTERVLDEIRKDTYGDDVGQNSWLTVDEYDRWLPWLELSPARHLLEVASGSGGPALHVARVTGCRVTGVDVNASGVATATQAAAASPEAGRLDFRIADATAKLPFDDGSFDALLCIDSMNHLPDRRAVLEDWRRVLRPGGRAIFTDPVVVTGLVTNEELALRSSIGLFVFAPDGLDEKLIEIAGLRLVEREDVTANAAGVSRRWHDARAARREALLRIEGEERFEGLQKFFAMVHRLTSERRLSRIAYKVERPAE
jgi:SAM-dependent methyltransferase